jgi:hypothetical protein
MNNSGTKWIGDDDRRSPRQASAGNPAISSFDHSRPEALRPRLAAGLPHARNCYSGLTVLGIRAGLTHCNSSQCTDIRVVLMSRITDTRSRARRIMLNRAGSGIDWIFRGAGAAVTAAQAALVTNRLRLDEFSAGWQRSGTTHPPGRKSTDCLARHRGTCALSSCGRVRRDSEIPRASRQAIHDVARGAGVRNGSLLAQRR